MTQQRVTRTARAMTMDPSFSSLPVTANEQPMLGTAMGQKVMPFPNLQVSQGPETQRTCAVPTHCETQKHLGTDWTKKRAKTEGWKKRQSGCAGPNPESAG